MKNKTFILSMACVITLFLTSCSSTSKESKTVLSLKEFTTVMDNDGSKMRDMDFLGDATLEILISSGMAVNETKGYTVSYLQAEDVETAKLIFGWMSESIKEQTDSMAEGEEQTGAEGFFIPTQMTMDYQEVYYVVNGYCVRAIRVENLLIEVNSTAGSVEEVIRIFRLLGY